MRPIFRASVIAALAVAQSSALSAQPVCKEYQDSQGNRVRLHPRSFVDKVVCPGMPGCPNEIFRIQDPKYSNNHPANAIGPPSYKQGTRTQGGIYSLGCRGSATWEFDDNLIVDVPGPDILIFEVGSAKEATRVEVSADRTQWIEVGKIEGSVSSVDIAPYVSRNQTFRYVRLTDLGTSCRNPTAGADIDAIATFGYSWTHIEDDSSIVFFEFAKAALQNGAKEQLDRVFDGLPTHKLRIVGHTDSVGRPDSNLDLSLRRAEAVGEYLAGKSTAAVVDVEVFGRGDQEPVTSNATPAGRARNRRVEITFIPLTACP
jgi:outer membrane protein OmpA-like peptidoglycan-associated protein